jgi:CheY-like chemotaxis protein
MALQAPVATDLRLVAAILDVMLSGNPTVEFARTLVQRGVPFVFATGYADREDLFSEFPGTPVIGKPYLGAI